MNSAHDLTNAQIDNLAKQGDAPKITPEQVEALIVKEEFHRAEGTNLITCVLTLKNGFAVSGFSSCVGSVNFKEHTGQAIARRNAKDKVFELEGYVLKNKLALIQESTAPSKDSGFKTYVGTKVVHAFPMTRLAYNNLRGWLLPDNEDGSDDGYLVEYADGGSPNVDGYKGYISWSPHDVFERAYTHGVTLKKTTYVERMVKELEELSDRVEKLGLFTEGSAFRDLSIQDRQDLMEQLHAMTIYQAILTRRLQATQDKS